MYKTPAKSLRKRRLVSIIAILFIAAAVLGILQMTHAIHLLPRKNIQQAPVSAGQQTKGEKVSNPSTSSQTTINSSNPSQTSTGSNTTSPGDAKGTIAPTTTLVQPTGDFVSAHKNVPLNATLSSVCSTTAGAKCQIIFTSGDMVKSLPAQTTDRGGATYWNSWTPTSIGLGPGSWQVKAVATLGSQSQTNIDAMSLDIQ